MTAVIQMSMKGNLSVANEISLGPDPKSWVDAIASRHPRLTRDECEKAATVLYNMIAEGMKEGNTPGLVRKDASGDFFLEILDVGRLLELAEEAR